MDVLETLTQEDIPTKLRCAICSKLALDAFRLPCCDQNICGTCHASLPESCPVCAHNPLSADVCKPVKSLRLTVKAFLKQKEKKLKSAAVTATPETPITPITPAPAVVQSVEETADTQVPAGEGATQVVHNGQSPEDPEGGAVQGNATVVGGQSAHQPTVEAPTQTLGDARPSNAGDKRVSQTAEPSEVERSKSKEAQEVDTTHHGQDQDGKPADSDGNSQNQGQNVMFNMGQNPVSQMGQMGQVGQVGQMAEMFGNNFGFNGQNAYAGMDWNSANGYNPMMQMQMGGMPGGGYNGYMDPSMMGMNSMGMPQGMYGGFGGQGMGMNGMNGMGMGIGFNGYGGWGGQQMSGFGANAGYYPGGGYNQQSHQGQFPHQMHHQQFPKNNYQNQNRFHGQKSYGLGHHGNYGPGYDHGQGRRQSQTPSQMPITPTQSHHDRDQQSKLEDGAFVHQLPTNLHDRRPSQQTPVDPQQPPEGDQSSTTQNHDAGATKTEPSDHEANLLEVDRNDADLVPEQENTNHNETPQDLTTLSVADTQRDATETQDARMAQPSDQSVSIQGVDQNQNVDASYTGSDMPLQAMPMQSQMPMMDQSMDQYGAFSQDMMTPMGMGIDYSHRGRGGMRGGYGRGGFRGRGGPNFHSQARYNSDSSNITVLTPEEPKGQGVEGAPTGPKAMREGLPNTGFRGRGGFPGGAGRGQGHTPAAPSADESHELGPSPDKNEEPRARNRSPRHSPSRSRSRSLSESRSRRRRSHRHRSPSTSTEAESRDRRRDRRRHRSSRKADDDVDTGEPKHEDPVRDEESRRSPEPPDSLEESSSHRRSSRRDRDKYRSSRSHRDRSREHRRHRHRSRSPPADDTIKEERRFDNDIDEPTSSSSRRKDRSSHKEKKRERGRDRDRSRERDRDVDRKRRRDSRSRSPISDREYEERRSSRRHRRDRDRDRDRAKDRSSRRSPQYQSEPAFNPPTGPAAPTKSQDGDIKILGRSRTSQSSLPPTPTTAMAPPTGPRSQRGMDPPKGPAADRNRRQARRQRTPSPDSSVSPPPPAVSRQVPPVDQYAFEREARMKERMEKEEQRRKTLASGAVWGGAKRTADDAGFRPPTGPSADRNARRKFHRGSDVSGGLNDEDDIDGTGARAARGGGAGRKRGGRRSSGKYDDEENDEARARRVEMERESARWVD